MEPKKKTVFCKKAQAVRYFIIITVTLAGLLILLGVVFKTGGVLRGQLGGIFG